MLIVLAENEQSFAVLLKNFRCNFRGGAGGVGEVLEDPHARPLPILIDAEIIPESCRLDTTASVRLQQNGMEPKSVTETVGYGEVAGTGAPSNIRRNNLIHMECIHRR